LGLHKSKKKQRRCWSHACGQHLLTDSLCHATHHACAVASTSAAVSTVQISMVFGRFRGKQQLQQSQPALQPEELPESIVVIGGDVEEEDDGILLVQDVKQQMTDTRERAGTGATTDEECVDAAEECEAWDWAIEGDSSTEGSVNKWILDDFLVHGEGSVEQLEGTELASHVQAPAAAKAEQASMAAETGSNACDLPIQQNSPVAVPQSPTNSVAAEKEEEAQPAAPESEDEEEHGYRCQGCNCLICLGADILSSNYQAMTGPGYLIASTRNVTYAPDTQAVTYTTGTYRIREVSCEFCDNKLGVTYVLAPDGHNQYKVGKFLVGADRLILPPGETHPKAA